MQDQIRGKNSTPAEPTKCFNGVIGADYLYSASLCGEKSLHCAIAEESFVFRYSDGTTIRKRQIARMDIDHHFSYDSIRIILKNGKIKTAVAENKQIAVRENGAYKLYSLAKIDSVITGT